MKVAVVGGGGREHALGWKISQSPLVEQVVGIPGNPGWKEIGPTWTDQDLSDFSGFAERLLNHGVELVVVGPEAPLVDGMADALRQNGLLVFGPGQDGAILEGSKRAAKSFMDRHGIPTAAYGEFTDLDQARAYIRQQGAPIVVKADGLAAGKGVIVAMTEDEALAAVDDMLGDGRFGDAGARVVVEAFLDGEEVSILALSDGKSIIPLAPSQDHKRIFDGDEGPNTGGMGAYTPTGLVTEELMERIQVEILDRTLAGFQADEIDFRGVVYCGLMIVDGEPQVLEYNVRFGDPECQPLLVHMDCDLVPLLLATARGDLASADKPVWKDGMTICVVMASAGYPEGARKGDVISGLGQMSDGQTIVFHAGTGREDTGELVTNGGRVLGVTAHGKTLDDARRAVYARVEQLAWEGCQYRTDIGWREIRRAREH